MALNSRQKRARKRRLALTLLAISRNPTGQPVKGAVRSAEAKISLLVPPSGKPRGGKHVSVGRPVNWEGKGKRKAKAITKPKSSVPLEVTFNASKEVVKSELRAPTRSDLAGLYPRERLQATKSASHIAQRKREAAWGVKES